MQLPWRILLTWFYDLIQTFTLLLRTILHIELMMVPFQVKSIEMEGLNWGASKLVPVGYGIKKLQIMCTVVDDLVSIEELQEKIEEFEDYVQNADVAAMNKI